MLYDVIFLIKDYFSAPNFRLISFMPITYFDFDASGFKLIF